MALHYLFPLLISTFTGLFAMGFAIPRLLMWQKGGQPIREDGPTAHLNKKGTPTMGGLVIFASMVVPLILFGDLANRELQILIFATVSFGFIGFIDDFIKIKKRNIKGFRGSVKLIIQIILSAVIIIGVKYDMIDDGVISIPFSSTVINLGALYIIFAIFVVSGTANAANLTDGLDGLLAVLSLVVLAVFALILSKDNQNAVIFIASLSGALLAFLWHNCFPAKIFMGDVGSLGIGGAISALVIIAKCELLIVILGGVFLLEALSVILQVGRYKLTGKRFFLMAPIHHHFEKLGWSETQVTMRFLVIGVILALIALSGY